MGSEVQLFNVTVKDDNLIVSGRELHEKLGIDTPYTMWFPRMCEYGFTEGKDFNPHNFVKVQIEGGREVERAVTDHELSVAMAKELCMIQRSSIGKIFREYFLKVEADWNSPHKLIARALLMANNELVIKEAQIAMLEPKALLADSITASDTCIIIRDFAKILMQNGIETGERRLYGYFRQHGYLCNVGASRNMPTQRAMDLKLFEVTEYPVQCSTGVEIKHTTKITPKGQQYFINHFLGRKAG